MEIEWDAVSHITKVDPAEAMPDDLDILGHTDLVMVGGSDNVTAENTVRAIERVSEAVPDLPILQEPYSGNHVSSKTIDSADGIAVPAVYNGDREHFVQKHLEFFTKLGKMPAELRGTSIPLVGNMIESRGRDAVAAVTEQIIAEGYIIQNPDSRAAGVTNATTPLTTEEVVGAAIATETFYRFPIFYIEYSGMYGGPEDVEAAAAHLEDTILLYGGGIASRDQAEEILAAGADAIVVGNCFHDEPDRFLDTIPE